MYQVEVMRGSSLGPLLDSIIELDRTNMHAILRESGLPFPEAERVARLSDPSTDLVVVRSGARLAGYVEISTDPRHSDGVYVASLQIAAEHRGGPLLAHLLGRAGLLLRARHPSSIRVQAQRANSTALALFRKLGLRMVDPDPSAVTLEAVAGPEILESPSLQRLIRRHQQLAAGGHRC